MNSNNDDGEDEFAVASDALVLVSAIGSDRALPKSTVSMAEAVALGVIAADQARKTLR